MSEVKHPGNCVNKPLENDYFNNGHPNPSDPQFRWNGPNTSRRPAALTPAQLDEIRANAPKPLPTFAERARAAAEKGETVKPGHTILSR